MCIAILDNRPDTTRLAQQVLKRCREKNPDGMGIMWAQGGELRTFKTLNDFNAIWNRYTSARDEALPVAVHFRKNTKGKTTLDNCHPFEIYPGDFAFMHNGTVYSVSNALEDDESDTARMCKVFQSLPGNFLNDPILYDMVKKYVSGDRFLFMDSKGRIAIINEYSGKWEAGSRDDGGVWFSHTRDHRYFLTGEEPTQTAAQKAWYDRRSATGGKNRGTEWNNEQPSVVNGRKKALTSAKFLSNDKRLIFIYGDLRDDMVDGCLSIPENDARFIGYGEVDRARLVAVCPPDRSMIPVMRLGGGYSTSVKGIVLSSMHSSAERLVEEIRQLLPSGYYNRANVPVDIGDKQLRAHTFVANMKNIKGQATIDIPEGDWRQWLIESDILEWQTGVFETVEDEEEEQQSKEIVISEIEEDDDADDRDPDTDNVIDLVDRMAAKGHITDPFDDHIQCPSRECGGFDTYPYSQQADDISFGTTISMLWCQSCQNSYPIMSDQEFKELN